MRNLTIVPAHTKPRMQHRVARPAVRPKTYTVEEAASLLGISRSHAYACVKTGELPSLRLRRRIVVPVHALDAMLEHEVG